MSVVLQPADDPPAMVRALEVACSDQIGRDAACHVGGAQVAPTDVAAELTWGPGHLVARIKARGPGGESARRMEFRAADPELERWRSVGFAIGALAGGLLAPRYLPARPLFPVPPAPPVFFGSSTLQVWRTEAARSERPLTLGATMTGVGGILGAPVLGPELRLSVGLEPTLGITLAGGTSMAGGRHGVTQGGLTWFSGGVRGWLGGPMLRAGVRFELLVEELRASVERPHGTDSQARWQPGGRAGADLEIGLGRALAVTAGAEAGVRSGQTVVFVRGAENATLPILRPGASVGLVARY